MSQHSFLIPNKIYETGATLFWKISWFFSWYSAWVNPGPYRPNIWCTVLDYLTSLVWKAYSRTIYRHTEANYVLNLTNLGHHIAPVYPWLIRIDSICSSKTLSIIGELRGTKGFWILSIISGINCCCSVSALLPGHEPGDLMTPPQNASRVGQTDSLWRTL